MLSRLDERASAKTQGSDRAPDEQLGNGNTVAPSVPAVAPSVSNVPAKNGQKNMKEREELTYADI